MTLLTLTPGAATLRNLAQVYYEEAAVVLDTSCRDAVEIAAERIAKAVAGNAPVYGVNTGFGKLANIKIENKDTAILQRNLILSHCCGVGEPISRAHVRLIMVLKLLSLGRGASGDLAPLAHMTAVIIGEGEAEFEGVVMPGRAALEKAGLTPISLGPKEGLAFINGTQFSTAFALSGLFGAWGAANATLVTSAMSTDAIMGSTAPLQPEIHALRGHRGQIEAADTMRNLLDGSEIRESHREGDTRVQDPYCIRCQPQVTGAAMDILRQAATTLQIEANAATDNPLVLVDADMIVSGGNFHAEPVGFAADMIALAVSEIGAIAQRRVALMVDPTLSFDLPPFLTPNPGLNSGYMIAEVTTAALMSENKHLANPCVTDSTPTSANQEDHVSMAAHGAFRLQKMLQNLYGIIGVELLCAAQGIEFRAPLTTSGPIAKCAARLRKDVATMGEDRYLAPDIANARDLIASGALPTLSGVDMPRLEG
jgi:histidine ammonia-lyase